VRRQLAAWGCEELTDAAVLCVSELVTNAVIHTRTPLSLTLRWAPPRLRVELYDRSRSAAIGARTLAAVGGHVGDGEGEEPVSQATSGRGLLIIAALAATVGETIEDDGKTVWFELEAGREAGAGPAVIVQQPGSINGDHSDRLPTVRLLGVPVGIAVASDDHLIELTRELSLDRSSPLAARLLGALADADGCFPFDEDWREQLRAARVFGNPRLDIEFRVDAERLAALRRVAAHLDEAEDVMRSGGLLTLPPPVPVGRYRHWVLEEIAGQLAGARPEPPPQTLRPPDRAPGKLTGSSADDGGFLDLNDPVQLIARLRRERAVVETLQRVGKVVTSRLTMPEVVQVAVDAAIEVTPAAFGVFEPGFRADGTCLFADTATDLGGVPVRSYLAVPVVLHSGEVVGGLLLGHHEPGRFGAADARLVEGIAGYAAIAIENARLYEAAQQELEARRQLLEERAHVAATLQASLVPPDFPVIPGLAVAGCYRPGASDVGGDFYDVFPVRGRYWGFILGDVCGKGPAAAAKTALARYTLRTAAMLERRPADVLGVLNDALLQRGEAESFCSAVYARLRAVQSGVAGELVVAGHPRPLVRRASGEVERLETGGALLGIFEGDIAKRVPLSLAPGDMLVLYTDGVTEARRSGELFGEDRLVETLAGAGPTVEDAVRAVEEAITAFGDHQRADDVAILAIAAV
jgi:serine phosphatase RsbU (regulator of sigma subunit)